MRLMSAGHADVALQADDLALRPRLDLLHRLIERLAPARGDGDVGAGCAKRIAMAKPRPFQPPVTMAARPESEMSIYFVLGSLCER